MAVYTNVDIHRYAFFFLQHSILRLILYSIAVMNLLPIPALDGGRIFLLLVTLLIEAVSRRRLDPKYEGYIHTGGMVLLLGLMAYVMFNDIIKIVH